MVRTEPTPGRGGASYSTFVYAKAKQDPPLTEAGPVSADAHWERITYFLERVVPVAEEYKVKIACHPHDPAMPRDKGYRGVHRVLGSVDGLKRFVSIRESPYHGLNFCQGTVSEMLEKPGEEIYDVIRYFGARKKIFNVHFRNIKGRFLNFQETFPDDGDVDMIRAMRVYKEVGYDGMIMPDHAPHIDGDDRRAAGVRLRVRLHRRADPAHESGGMKPAICLCGDVWILAIRQRLDTWICRNSLNFRTGMNGSSCAGSMNYERHSANGFVYISGCDADIISAGPPA